MPHPTKFHVLTGPNGSGKTRYVSWLADRVIDDIKQRESEFSYVVCLSGPIVDKFSPRVYKRTLDFQHFQYLGYRTNNNAFSELAPFRVLFSSILARSVLDETTAALATSVLGDLNLSPVVSIVIPSSRPASDVYRVDFSSTTLPKLSPAQSLVRARFEFNRPNGALAVQDLSAGERWYLLLMLSVCFCVKSRSLLLIDEPESSLHPELQLQVMQRMVDILGRLDASAAVVIATHSPLIVASVPNERSLICDMGTEQQWRRKALFGQSADTVLTSHFDVISPRSPEATLAIQSCLSLIAFGRADTPAFEAAFSALEALGLRLHKSDPLYETLETIRRFGRGVQ